MRHCCTILLVALALSGCGAGGVGYRVGGPPFGSPQSPPDANSASNSEPQPAGSLPPTGYGLGGGANAGRPNFGAVTLGAAPY